jgi:hypothetical protein
LIDDGRTGLVPPDDRRAARPRVAHPSPARAAMLGAAAREVARRYSFDRMVVGFEISSRSTSSRGASRASRVFAGGLGHVRHHRTINYGPFRPVDRGVLEAMTDAVAIAAPTPPAITWLPAWPRPPRASASSICRR